MKKTEINVLKELIAALIKEETTVSVDTITRGTFNPVAKQVDRKSALPVSKDRYLSAAAINRSNAESISVGGDISIRLVHPKTEKRELYYLVKTPSGSAKFTRDNSDFMNVWYSALNKFSGMDHNANVVNPLRKNLEHPELLELVGVSAVVGRGKFKKSEEKILAAAVSKVLRDTGTVKAKSVKTRTQK